MSATLPFVVQWLMDTPYDTLPKVGRGTFDVSCPDGTWFPSHPGPKES